ncbi:MAG: chromate transporter [Acidaminococcus sp.]|jgi:chromate transporter|nr:chromate transporter [Acidaminococcus sp.]MCI2101033.1 chromate transporter [Acidaminococcus sp.]
MMEELLLDFQLFWQFFKTGLFAVGGGLATLPFLQEMGQVTHWFTMMDVADMVAVSESTPGPLGVNMATYVGFKTAGLEGGLVATLGLVTPSVIIILIIARILQRFKESKTVKKVFYGLRPASTALIMAAGLSVAEIALLRTSLWKATGSISDLFSWKLILLAAVVWICYRKWKFHPILYIAVSAAIGVVFSL